MDERPAGGDGKALEEEIEHEPNVNQIQDEPIPASHDDDRRQEAVVRNEELSASADDESTNSDEDADGQDSW